MTKLSRFGAPALLVLLAACQPQASHHVASSSPAQPASSEESVAARSNVPKPVEIFEGMCYRMDARFSKIVEAAKALDYPEVPKSMMSILGPMTGSGKGFVVVNNKKKQKVILLGASDQNACSIYANGYDAEEIKRSVAANYHLLRIHRDDTGLQVNEMYIPNGKKGTQSEGRENGLVGLTYAKNPSDDAITLSFVSPETAKRILR